MDLERISKGYGRLFHMVLRQRVRSVSCADNDNTLLNTLTIDIIGKA